MPLSWNGIKSRAIAFAKEWEHETSEDAKAKSQFSFNLNESKMIYTMKSYRRLRFWYKRKTLLFFFKFISSILLISQFPNLATCQCVGYKIEVPDFCACNSSSGRTSITVRVTAAPGQSWTVKSVSGLYSTLSPNLLTPLGTVMENIGGSIYTLDALRLNTAGFWIQVTNGICDLDIKVGNLDPCTYNLPTVAIDPDGIPANSDEYTLYVHPTDNVFSIEWGGFGTDIPGLPNFTEKALANTDFDGLANTQSIVNELGVGFYAAKFCADLVVNGCDDWYLPALGELNAMFLQLGPAGNNGFIDFFYWSSTEYDSSVAWLQAFGYHFQIPGGKDNSPNLRCVKR